MLNLLGVAVAFIVIIVLIRKKFNFGVSLLLGSLIVGVFSLHKMELIDIPKAIIEASFYSFETDQIVTQTIELAILLTLVYLLARLMQETGAINRLIDSLRPFFSKGGLLGAIPALYGLMPVPGGALFSAPMVDEEGSKHSLNKNQKNFLNVWFRHIWFPIYPVSSAMITLIALVGAYSLENNLNIQVDISMLILANLPAFIISVLIGILFLRRFIKKIENPYRKVRKDYSGLVFLIPPILPLIFYAFLSIFGISEIRSFLMGVFSSIILLFILTKVSKKEFIQLVKKSLTINLALAIFGIMIFREIIDVSGTSQEIANIISGSIFPSIYMIIIIPLILGLVTGYNLGAIGLSFPIVSEFFPYPLDIFTLVGLTSLIFISSLVGYLISPIHLCNVLSSDYLKTDTTRMYKMYIPAAISMLIIQITIIGSIIYLVSF
ncbi:MAG: DUF401 family protein [Petrotogales bacterium]